MQIAFFLVLGAGFGAAFVWIASSAKLESKRVLAYGLFAAAAIYVVFAFRSDNLSGWLAVEMTGVAIYGSLALLSLIGSPWWLVAGWAARPLWAIQFHYLGTGSVFTPEWYPLIDTGFGLAVAAYVAFTALRRVEPPRSAPAAPVSRKPATSKPAKNKKGRAR